MIMIIHNAVSQDTNFVFQNCFFQEIKDKRFILVPLKDIFSIDTAIHSMMECTFISQSYSSHNVFSHKRVKKVMHQSTIKTMRWEKEKMYD